MSIQGIFQLAFRVFILESEEFEHHRIADFLISGNSVLWFGPFAFEQHHGFVL